MNATQVKRLVFALLIATMFTVAAGATTEMPPPTTEAFPVRAQLLLIFGFPALVVAFLLQYSFSFDAVFLVAFFLQWFGLAYACFFRGTQTSQSGSASKQSFGRLRQGVSLILASVSAYSISVAADRLFGKLSGVYPNSERSSVFIYSVMAAILILVAGMVTDRKWPLIAPMVLFGVLDLYAGAFMMRQYGTLVTLVLFLFAFLCWCFQNRRT